MNSDLENTKSGRRTFLQATAGAGDGLAIAGGASAQSAAPGDLRLGQLRIIDLSVCLEHDAPGERAKPRIEYLTHTDAGLKSMMDAFGAKPEDFVYSNGHGWAIENLVVGSHTATHIDAPYHYGAISEGKPARRIDDVPLEWCFGPGVVLDMRHRKPGEVISSADLPQSLREIRYITQPGRHRDDPYRGSDPVGNAGVLSTAWSRSSKHPVADRPRHPHDRHRRVDVGSGLRIADC